MKKVLFLTLCLSALGSCRLSQNFHVVEDGKVYRSAQPPYEELISAHEMFGIKTVLNLRGGNRDNDWYLDEVRAVEETGMTLINIGMSARRLPHKEDLVQLLDVLENAEYPILIHCQAGADRTGEAVAIYMMEYMGKSKSEALKQALSFKTLHLEWRHPAKKYFIRAWEGLDWAYNVYDPCEFGEHYSKEEYCTGSGVLLRQPATEEDDT